MAKMPLLCVFEMCCLTQKADSGFGVERVAYRVKSMNAYMITEIRTSAYAWGPSAGIPWMIWKGAFSLWQPNDT